LAKLRTVSVSTGGCLRLSNLASDDDDMTTHYTPTVQSVLQLIKLIAYRSQT